MNKENKWQVTGRVASNLIVVFAGVAFYMALSNFDALRAQLRAWLGILSPFVWGLVIAYLLDAPVRFFESKLGGRRKLSILISYVLAFLVVGFLLRMVLPQIGDSLFLLAGRIPSYLDNLSVLMQNSRLDELGLDKVLGSYQELLEKATGMVSSFLPKIVGYGVAIGNGFISAVTALISSVYMLMGKDRLLRPAAQGRAGVAAAAPGPQRAGGVLPRQPGVRRVHHRQNHRQQHHRGAVLCVHDPAAPALCGAHQRDRGRHQHHPLFRPLHRRGAQHSDPADRGPHRRAEIRGARAAAAAV